MINAPRPSFGRTTRPGNHHRYTNSIRSLFPTIVSGLCSLHSGRNLVLVITSFCLITVVGVSLYNRSLITVVQTSRTPTMYVCFVYRLGLLRHLCTPQVPIRVGLCSLHVRSVFTLAQTSGRSAVNSVSLCPCSHVSRPRIFQLYDFSLYFVEFNSQ
jgi:hypothetical protein